MTAVPVRVLAACLLLAVAGCTAPVADQRAPVGDGDGAADAPRTTAAPTTGAGGAPEGVQVTGGDLEPDANRTFERVQALVGAEYAGTRVFVRDLTQYKTADYGAVPFFDALGVPDPELDEGQPTGLTTLDATVYVSPANASAARVEQVLAHEFVHVAQLRGEIVPWFGALSLSRVSLDERFARRALVEGGAVYVTDAYTRAHLPGERLQSERVAAAYENGSAGNRVVWSQYHFGVRYVGDAVDAPGDLPAVYEDAPETTENVLHPGERDAVVPLDVDVEAGEYTRTESPTVRAGELLARIVLRDATNESVATEAAAGWGNDRVVAFADGADSHVAWVTRWDTTRDADEFAAAADALGDRPGVAHEYRVERVDDATVVVFAGDREFVDDASASGNVTVAA
ncbi:hypothetical protein [Halobacterium yunchengense]|uniref:hypothetical protein n=1 Tax=Halobacterium yunchengense TaxID=3108497 RepID=UPI0030094899